MGQSISRTHQGGDWTNAANYTRYLQSDRRTWAWLWLNRNPTFQQSARNTELTEWSQRNGPIVLVENLCRHF